MVMYGIDYNLREPTPAPPRASPSVLATVGRGDPHRPPGYELADVNVTSGGSGYTDGTHDVTLDAPTGLVSPDVGTAAVVTLTVASGAVTNVDVKEPGAGYPSNQPSSITVPGSGSGAAFTFVRKKSTYADYGEVVAVNKLTNPNDTGDLHSATALFGNEGELYDAVELFEELATVWVVLVRSGGGVSDDTCWDNLDDHNNTGHQPKLLAGQPRYTGTTDGSTNAHVTRMATVAANLGAYAWVDTRTLTDAVQTQAQGRTYGTNNGSMRVQPVYQRVRTPEHPNSWYSGAVYAAARQAAVDAEKGIQRSISNLPLPHVVAVDPEISFRYVNNTHTDAHAFRAVPMLCFIKHDGIYLAWGAETKTQNTGSRLRKIPYSRVLDELEERSTEAIYVYVDESEEGVPLSGIIGVLNRLYLRMASEGKLRSAEALESALNTDATRDAGEVYIDVIYNGQRYYDLITVTVQPD